MTRKFIPENKNFKRKDAETQRLFWMREARNKQKINVSINVSINVQLMLLEKTYDETLIMTQIKTLILTLIFFTDHKYSGS